MLLDFLPTERKEISSMAKRSAILDFLNTDSNVSNLGAECERVEVRKALEVPPTKRGKYKAWTAKDRSEIGKYADAHGDSATIHHFATRHPELKRQTVDNFKRLYQKNKRAKVKR